MTYPGYDFNTSREELSVAGAGLTTVDLDSTTWKKGYGVVLGVYGPGEQARLTALRQYQPQIRHHRPDRDEMILLNTWGDRNRDTRVIEAFLLTELDDARLRINLVQIDDGWQQRLPQNSACSNGRLWDEWDAKSWQPKAQRFPNGLAPVAEKPPASAFGWAYGFTPATLAATPAGKPMPTWSWVCTGNSASAPSKSMASNCPTKPPKSTCGTSLRR